jgi:8-oxo-dGTP pyrophosphatase MutT (NUDIX family)
LSYGGATSERRPILTEVIARPAATVLLLRDGAAGIEVLMITRHTDAAFAGGALVFPGGRVDGSDGAPEMLARCRPVAGADAAAMALRIAAIRETFEEAHVLLARPRGEDRLLGAAALAEVERRAGSKDFAALVATGAIELAADLLVPYAHWITPEREPKRFDTHFFLAPAPLDQVAAHDGSEAVDSLWTTAAAAIAASEAKQVSLIFPTRMNLIKLGRSRTVAEALAAARASPIITVMPVLAETPDGMVLRIPLEAGYGISEISTRGLPRANRRPAAPAGS